MSVVRLDVRNRRERDPPERRERRQGSDERDDPRVGADALVPGEAARESDRQQRERAQLPTHAITSSAGARSRASAAAPSPGVSTPPQPDRIRAVSVAK